MRFSLSSGATSAVACLLAALAGKGFAQAESELEPGPSRQRLSTYLEHAELAEPRLEEIRREESANGPYSPALVAQLQAVALLYREIGRNDLAAASIEKALQVERANFGLFSLDQVPLIEQLIAAERERGDAEAVAELERRLLNLAHYHPNDLRSMEILRDAGDRDLALFDLYRAGSLPPEISISIGFVPGPSRSPPAGRFSVARAQRHYIDAIGVLLRNESYGHEALRELERKLLYTYYLELTETEPSSYRMRALSQLGAQAHERIVAYHSLNQGSIEDVARALVELADWELLFSRNGTAVDRYREVHAMLAGEEGYEDLLAELFTPETPVVLPAFVPNPLVTTGPTTESYVDVAFEISRYGKSRGIDVLETNGEAAKEAARRLTRLISRSRFRPIFRDGALEGPSSVVVRYRF